MNNRLDYNNQQTIKKYLNDKLEAIKNPLIRNAIKTILMKLNSRF